MRIAENTTYGAIYRKKIALKLYQFAMLCVCVLVLKLRNTKTQLSTLTSHCNTLTPY